MFVVVCTGVLFMVMSFMMSSCSMLDGLVAILHLCGLTCIRHCLSQCSMFVSSCLSLVLA